MTSDAVACYYGDGKLPALARYTTVVLQGEFYTNEELAWLAGRGVRVLCYLSLTQDVGPPAEWQREERDPDWGGAYVHVGSPAWQQHVLGQARQALRRGFSGLFLDTLNVELTVPEDLPHLLDLVRALRDQSDTAYLLANRGFGLLPTLAELVDGVLFESFATRWVDDGYAPWPPDVLKVHRDYARRLTTLDVDLYALDYADTPELRQYAHEQAALLGMPCFVSDRALSQI